MDALRFLAAGAALMLCWWIYAHGWANVIEAVAIVLAKHARWLRRAHEGREQKQYGQLTRLLVEDNEAVQGVPELPDIAQYASPEWKEYWQRENDEELKRRGL